MIYLTRAMLIMAFFILSSCSFILNKITGEEGYDVLNLGEKNLALVFSHNIHGETHPCGCRHHPLGGLAQVAGQIETLKKDHQVIYVDSGDTLFDSSSIPETLRQSKTFNAKNLAKGLAKAGLKYWVPGDFDFAIGLSFIKEVAKDNSFELLIANVRKKEELPAREFAIIAKGPHRIFLAGMVHPDTLPSQYQKHFLPVQNFMPGLLRKLKEKGYEPQNPFHRFVLISHAGKDNDDLTAKKYPEVTWIIGAHSQSFYRTAQETNKTKIVQVLSRNHYLGQVTFNLSKDKSQDSYVVHEMRDNVKDGLKPNPFIAFVNEHKEKVKEIRLQEQEVLVEDTSENKYNTAGSCIECHDKQGEFWQGTSHAMAYSTLIKANEENNLSCVKCHSLGQGHKKGFVRAKDIVVFEKPKSSQQYWQEVRKAFVPEKSVRKLSVQKRRSLAQQWLKLDEKHKVTHNFSGVQCLNCHDKHDKHPWESFAHDQKGNSQSLSMQSKCLACHDSDQSPQWYHKKDNGAPGALNDTIFKEKLNKMTCPKEQD